MGKKIYLTKKRMKALHNALTFDDILYEKFKRLNEQLHRDVKELHRNPSRVFEVVEMKDGVFHQRQIKRVEMANFGSRIYI